MVDTDRDPQHPGSAGEGGQRSRPAGQHHLRLAHHSQYGNAGDKQDVQGEQRVWIHPDDAAERDIADGDAVRVFNDRGSFSGPAVVDDIVMKGLVMANVGHRQNKASGNTVNTITLDRHNQLGNSGVYSDNLVEVAKIVD
jgi:anaerobic selenocysteine-containing dehydrogenase